MIRRTCALRHHSGLGARDRELGDQHHVGVGRGQRLAGLLSASLAYDITPSVRARFFFHRVFARHSRDADVLLWGISRVS